MMRSALGGFYQKKAKYATAPSTDKYLNFDFGLSDFCNHDYAIAMKRFKGGIAETKQGYGLQKPSNLARQYVYLGMCKQRMRDFSGAVEDFNLALKIDPNMTHNNTKAAVMRIGQCYAMTGDHKTAVYYYDQLLNSNSGPLYQSSDPMYSALNTDRVYYLRAVSRLSLGDRAGAKDDCLNALKIRNQVYPKAAELLKQIGGDSTPAPIISGDSKNGGVVTVQEFGPNGQFSSKTVSAMPIGGMVDFSKQSTLPTTTAPIKPSPDKVPSVSPPTPNAISADRQQQLDQLARDKLQEQNVQELALREVSAMLPTNRDVTAQDIDRALQYIENTTQQMGDNAMLRAAEVMVGMRSVWSKIRGDFQDMLHFQGVVDNLVNETTRVASEGFSRE